MIKTVKNILIVGGGTAGWMAAAALAERYREQDLTITLIESEAIGGVGVGEATVPGIRAFHQRLGISEREFILATQATFKLGIQFRDWCQLEHAFFHPFSAFGAPIADQDFYQCWLKLHAEGHAHQLEDYSLAIAMARAGRFAQPDEAATTPLAWYNYAYHFDAGLYAKFLRRYAEQRGVLRTEGKVVKTNRNTEEGSVLSVQLESGEELSADLFIDCSGFKALLIEDCLAVGFEDWSHWLPCNSAITVQTSTADAPLPYTISTALSEGWQWKIPLQHRVGNGYVYSSDYCDDRSAEDKFLVNVSGDPINTPRLIKFTTGIRKEFWHKNCVALGLASGFIEPLESTSISLIQTGIDKLIQFMPNLQLNPENISEANRLNRLEYERIRDFIVLHYKASMRSDSDFWRDVRAMEIPEMLMNKIEAFSYDGSVVLYEQESFVEQSWLAMFNGFQRVPRTHQKNVQQLDSVKLASVFEKMQRAIIRAAEVAPKQQDFLADLC